MQRKNYEGTGTRGKVQPYINKFLIFTGDFFINSNYLQ